MAKLEFTVTDENIDDILCIAMEGGINYWCSKAEVKGGDYMGGYASEVVSKGGTLIFHDAEDYLDPVKVDKAKMIEAVEKYVNEQDAGIVDLNTKEIDCCQVDAMVADMIVQLACFDEIVFG